jgi:hypothetical protein
VSKQKLRKLCNQSLAKSLHKQLEENSRNLLSFNHLIKRLHQLFETFPDCRQGSNISKNFNDAAMGAFALFFTQSPSFLAYQKLMRESEEMDNAQSLFGIEEILSDNHIRALMDEVPPSFLFPVFLEIFKNLEEKNLLSSFRSYNNNLLLGLDGTQYYSSKNICCKSCCQRRHSSSQKITYHHSVLMAALVHPENNQVISLPPEFITQSDGNEKQDCEINASRRWINQYGMHFAAEGVTILGDDLYCHQPFCQLLLSQGFDFIFTCKPTSHKTLYEYVTLLDDEVNTLEQKRWTGRRWLVDRYRYLNGVPLRDGQEALEVNWFELSTVEENSGKVLFYNSWVTNFNITGENVVQLVVDARTRWKIENENNNVLKTKGYHLEHNFGHGKKYLSQLFLTFNLLAFLSHTMLEITDAKYRRLRLAIGNRNIFFNDIRTLTRYMYFTSWDHMMIFMLKGLKLKIPDTG